MTDLTHGAQPEFIELATDIIAAYVSNNPVPVAELPALISNVHAALNGLTSGTSQATAAEEQVEKATPSQIRKSITPDALISFIDGKAYKTLKRHLTGHGLDPHSYRERYGLPRDYPMVAANYAAQRSELARAIGLGQQGGRRQGSAEGEETASGAPKTRGRSKKA